MTKEPAITELLEEIYRLEELINILSRQVAELKEMQTIATQRHQKELEALKAYYSGHIKELYQRSQLHLK